MGRFSPRSVASTAKRATYENIRNEAILKYGIPIASTSVSRVKIFMSRGEVS